MEVYDLCIIGAGLIGSSAAKHASKIHPNLKIALIGPPEPQTRETNQIFGSWFDNGRLYSLIHHSPAWAELARESILRFQSIKEESGEDFYQNVGYLEAATEVYNDLPLFEAAKEDLVKRGFVCCQKNGENISEILPFLDLPKSARVHYQPPSHYNAGHLNPRQLVRAQQKISEDNGCKIIRESVQKIKLHESQEEDKCFSLELSTSAAVSSQKVIRTKKILIATGVYSGLLSLISEASEGKYELDMTYTAQVVALMEVDEQMKNDLKLMPTMVTYFDPSAYTYILPPIVYPDGKSYLKFGCHDRTKNLKSLSEVTDYFVDGPDMDKVKNLVNFAQKIIPGLRINRFEGMSCVTCNTPKKRAPYIDKICEGVYVATGGCGEGAASCDEIGRVAATLAIQDKWDSNIERDLCRAKLRHL